MLKIFPFIFVVLWSSAFITTKPIIDNSDPFTALAFRFALVAFGFFLFSIYSKQKILVSKKYFFESFLSGVLLGFAGAGLVLGFDIGSKIPVDGLIATIIALLSITFSTLWQKKLSNNLPLSVNNMNQALGGCLFHLIIIILFVDPYIDFSQTFIIAMSHQIFLVSFGAFTILMYLIKHNSASKTVSIFFLIPATSAFMAWLFLNESLTNLDLIGFLITSIGVYIATRDQ